jgi:hypothetical protein
MQTGGILAVKVVGIEFDLEKVVAFEIAVDCLRN